MRKATLKDLYMEKFLRDREQGKIIWKTKDGKEIPMKELTDSHLDNIIKHLIDAKEYNDIAAEYDAYIAEHFD